MTGYSWIHPTGSSVLFGKISNLVPIKMTNDDILEAIAKKLKLNFDTLVETADLDATDPVERFF